MISGRIAPLSSLILPSFSSLHPALAKMTMTPTASLQPPSNKTIATSVTAHPFVPPQVAIVGGGLAGLAAATRLAELNVRTAVFDMGTRVLGGRACSRVLSEEYGGLAFDHGAQFFAPESEKFNAEVQKWVKAGAAAPWHGRFGILDAQKGVFTLIDALNGENSMMGPGFCGFLRHIATPKSQSGQASGVFVGVPNMGSVAQHLATELKTHGSSIKLDHKVWKIFEILYSPFAILQLYYDYNIPQD